MPIRIYALAKELKLDSKELVEACTKAGIPGKGSALASLTDEEVVKIKAFLSGGAKKPAAPTRTAAEAGRGEGAPERPSPARRSLGKGGLAGRTQRVLPTPSEPPAPAPPEEPPAEPEPTSEPATPPPAFTRDDYVSPIGTSNKIKVIGAHSKGSSTEGKKRDESAGERKPRRRAPVINVAPMPEVKQPTQPAAAEEPKAQKPEIRLPKDALTARKGQAPPSLDELAEKKSKKSRGPRHAAAKEQDDAPASSKRGRRGRDGSESEDRGSRGLAGMASARADRKARRSSRKEKSVSLSDGSPSDRPQTRRRRTLVRKGTNTAAPRKGKVSLELPCTVRSFSAATGASVVEVQKVLMGLGTMLTINSQIDNEMVELLASELGVELEFKQPETLEDTLVTKIMEAEDDPKSVKPRPPIVTFLGHVDHGKTSLLDYIIGTNVVAGEAGGITQHIRAYQIEKGDRQISFVDTPGHGAFTEMRARGANVTDIAVLVIAADDGIMPQTEEAISHAKAANVPIVVALNKMDLPGADANRAMSQMTEHGLTPSQWGGDIEVVSTSAITGDGVDDLLDTILTIADLHEYAADPQRPAIGTCLEAEQEGGRGVVAKLIVKKGTLHVGDTVLCGVAFGRVKAMYDSLRPSVRVEQAGPSMPVNITGFDSAPQAGDTFCVLPDISQAREIAARRGSEQRESSLSGTSIKISFDEFQRRLSEGQLGQDTQVSTLNLIIRADVRGSIEAIKKELGELQHPEVQIKILQASVGGVTVADVTLAHASEAVIIGFNVIPDEAARALAEERQVEIRRYDVIYKVTDDIRALLEGKLEPEKRVQELGQALVKQVFSISRVGAIAGCYVIRGSIERGCRIRVNRDGRTIGDYEMESLRREKDDIKEVPRGMECGIKLAGFNDVKKDDVLEAYKIEEVARTL